MHKVSLTKTRCSSITAVLEVSDGR